MAAIGDSWYAGIYDPAKLPGMFRAPCTWAIPGGDLRWIVQITYPIIGDITA